MSDFERAEQSHEPSRRSLRDLSPSDVCFCPKTEKYEAKQTSSGLFP